MRWCLVLLLAVLLGACGYDGPTVSQADRAAGAEMHPQLLAEFGGSYDGDEAAYVARVGDKIAVAAQLQGQCTFTLVNSDVVNAFAVPGCYIYVTRGLMGVVNSEAELGSVLAHEIGHIAARHPQRQQNRSIWRTLSVLAVQTLTGSERLTQIAGAAAAYFTLRYSRGQEYEADDVGLDLLTKAGYDPHASVEMLEALGRQEQFLTKTRGRDEARSIPEWARTHPLTGSRVARAEKAAAATGIAEGQLPEKELPYLRSVDGMLYGDDPEQGFVIGRTFAHPVMRIAFEAPEGFTLTNSPHAILIEGPSGMRGEFSGGRTSAGGLDVYTQGLLRNLLGKAPVAIEEAEPLVVNGVPSLLTRATVQTREGPASLWVAAYAAGAGEAYHFLMLSNSGSAAPEALGRLFASFRLIGEAEARTLRPRRIHVVAAGAADSWQTLARRMAGPNPRDHLLMLNGRTAAQGPKPGELIKLVVYGDGDR